MITLLRIAGIALTLSMMISCSVEERQAAVPINATEKPLGVTPTERPSLPTVTVTATLSNGYIGLKYPPLPSSINTSESWQKGLLDLSSSVSWGVDAVMDEKDIMLWLDELISRDGAGHAISEVRDIVYLPPSAKDKSVVVGDCVLAGQPDYEIVALVNLDQKSLDNRWLPNSNIISAWRANRLTGKFEEISTEKIECIAETFLDFP
jgi:hypothetical protein